MENIVYMMANLFRTYVLYRLIRLFLPKSNMEVRQEVFFFVVNYIMVCILHITIENVFFNICVNTVVLFFLTFVREGTLIKRAEAVICISGISIFLKSVSFHILERIGRCENGTDAASIVANLMFFIVVLAIEKIVQREKGYQKGFLVGRIFYLIPFGSIIMVVIAFMSNYESAELLIIVGLLLGINTLVVYLYDLAEKNYENVYEKELLKHQNNAYINQFEIIMEGQRNIRIMKHDIKNHLFAMQKMLKDNKLLELEKYMEGIYDYINVKREFVSSGNKEIDSILNYKLLEAEKVGAKIKLDISIPDKIDMSVFDLNIILGNLMDNSIEALAKCDEEKNLEVIIQQECRVLYIDIINSYDGKIEVSKGQPITTKENRDVHGIGIESVKAVVEKYNGSIDFEFNNSIFKVKILLYNE